jgi:hypothetical protein
VIVLGALVAEGGARTCVFELSVLLVCFACSISARVESACGWPSDRVYILGMDERSSLEGDTSFG